jgi:hypothetical protein
LVTQYTNGGISVQIRQNGLVIIESSINDQIANADMQHLKAAYTKTSDGTISIKRRYNNSGDILTTSQKVSYVSVSQNLLLGCYQQANGTKGRFVKGILNDCKVYDGVLSDAEIEAYLNA